MVKQTARLDGKEVSGSGVVEVTTEEAVTIQKAALIMLMQATPEQRLAHVSLPESYTTEHIRAVYQNLPEFDEESLKARDLIVRASRLLTAKMERQTDARALVDAWRDEWHLEPEPEMDGATSQVYESLVNHVASALAAPASTVAPVEQRCWHECDYGGIRCSLPVGHAGTHDYTNAPASPAALRDEARTSRSVLAEIETALLSINNGVSPQVAVGQVFAIINNERAGLGAPLRDEAAPCINCSHSDPHDGPAGTVNDACTHEGCNCGYYQPATTPEDEVRRLFTCPLTDEERNDMNKAFDSP